MTDAATGSERDSISGWLATYCEEIQQRARTSHGRFRAVAVCELTTARAILRAIQTGAGADADNQLKAGFRRPGHDRQA
ncbi:hypothetical protein ACFOD9_07015 [Novosphingobium bradum]|uniref:Uncharacterized protein n=1 Tax=Novosphingobium bradum TaxID=1737444 RepID=A0ABV7ITE9_9SPHN